MNPASFWPLHLSDKGLVGGDGAVFARMSGDGLAGHLALDADGDRVVAMVSVLADRSLDVDTVLPPIAAAAAHWQRGDKALANLRLIFSRLPKPTDGAAVKRLALAEQILDDGLAPASLMTALWPQPADAALRRYNRDEPRVPAGHGVESGRWTFGDAGRTPRTTDGRAKIVVATSAGARDESDEERRLFEERERLGETTPQEEAAHGRGIDPGPTLPAGIGPGPFARRSTPAGPTPKPCPAQQKELNTYLKEDGCHTCGTTDPGTKSGDAVGDHQDPTALVSPGTPQRYFPQCIRCSRVQGGRVRAFMARKAKS